MQQEFLFNFFIQKIKQSKSTSYCKINDYKEETYSITSDNEFLRLIFVGIAFL